MPTEKILIEANVDKKDAVEDVSNQNMESQNSGLLYSVEENPSIPMTIILGFQHFLIMSSGTILISLVIINELCLDNNLGMQSEIIGTVLFVMGIATLLQTTFGVRLPIVQGATATLIVPILAMLSSPSMPKCDYNKTMLVNNNTGRPVYNTESPSGLRIRYISGTIMVGSAFQFLVGFSGVISLLMKCIGPLVIAPIITLIGLSLVELAANLSSSQWWIALTNVILNIVFTFYLAKFPIPIPIYTKEKKCHFTKVYIFSRCPLLLGVGITWMICAILTATNVFPNKPDAWGYAARSDVRVKAITDASWFKFPYPTQFGTPLILPTALLSVTTAFLCSILESIGDYYACAFAAGAPPPPKFAVNRGISFEGFCCFISGLLCCPIATTSYSDNIGLIIITKVGSRRVVQCAAVIMVIIGMITKAAAIFVSIPQPIIGGLFLTVFSMLTGIGISNLRYINFQSSRNVFIVGFSIFFGLAVSQWAAKNTTKIDLKYHLISETASVLLQTSMFVGGLTAFILDNTMPGSKADRGLLAMNEESVSQSNKNAQNPDWLYQIYEFVLCRTKLRPCLAKNKCLSRLPVCPGQRLIQPPLQRDEDVHVYDNSVVREEAGPSNNWTNLSSEKPEQTNL